MKTTVSDNLLESAHFLRDQLIEWRRSIHSQPELSFEERETARLVAGVLSELGYAVRPGIGGTGVMAEIGAGRTVVIRADMDALPIEEQTGQCYASKKLGVMHACGHDAHVACALGAAKLLSLKPPKTGRVRFLFQPAEETVNDDGKSGATLMIEQGAAEGAEGIFALHVDPRLPVGKIAVRDGAVLSACDTFSITIKGKGSHGAYPHFGVDAVVLASQVVQSLQTIVSRRKSALEPAVLTIGGIASNTYAANILAEEVSLIGTVRYFNAHLREFFEQEIKNACGVAEALGGGFELKYSHDTPALVNDPQLANLVRYVGKELLGDANVLEAGQEPGADDFSFLSSELPGCYFFLGVGIEGDPKSVHSPTFDIDEEALPLGAALLATAASRFLG